MSTSNPELDDIALKIYAESVRGIVPLNRVDRHALDAYHKAAAFLAIRKRVHAGELDAAQPVNPLSNCCAPNLPKTHPINLTSQQMGSLEAVNRVAKWLAANPTPDTKPEEILDRLQRELGYAWDLPTLNVARVVIPQYATTAKK